MVRVLLLHIPVGQGHTRAAQAVASALRQVSDSVRTRIADAAKHVNPVVARTVISMYMDVIRVTPAVWSYVYRQAEKELFAEYGRQELATVIRTLSSSETTRLLDEYKPDIIVSTHPFPLGVMSEMKRRGLTDAKLVGVITDYTVHPFWIYDNTDCYTLATESLLLSAAVRHLPDERLLVTGIPIDPAFSEPTSKEDARRRLGFLPDDRVVLVMGGGLGMGPVEQVVRELASGEEPVKTVVVVGKNQSLYQKLRQMDSPTKNVRVFGFIDWVHEIMAASDIIITKAGGLTAAEAMAKALPMIIVSPIPGQEQRNTDFLVTRGAAARADNAHAASELARRILRRERIMNAMRSACRSLGRPNAAMDIARFLLGE